ncbi:MAG: ABC transporter permease [Treponema sp.]|nr:ABC transporter permease [Treponema sp.]
MYQTKIALRSLIMRKRQYVSLFLVCMAGLAISLAAIAVSTGMIKSLNQKARIYYGGDAVLMCAKTGEWLNIYDYEEKIESVKAVLPKETIVSKRQELDGRRGSFYFEGVQALQQTFKGIEIENEKDLLKSLIFTEGGVESVLKNPDQKNWVFISLPIAKMLGVHAGDEITLQLETNDNVLNTVQIEVKGIFQDSSVFGMYTSYFDFEFLRDSYNRPKNYANRITIHFANKNVSEKNLHEMYDSLSSVLNMYDWVEDKDDFLDLPGDAFPSETWAFVPLSANLNDVEIMQLAMDAIISFIVIILTVIIIAGIGSTYRVLIMKRITEIGIYMALGMKKRSIIATLLFESFLLLVLGCIAGLLLNGIFCAVISLFDFSFIPSFDMFLEKGNLSPQFDVLKSVTVIVSVIIATLLSVLYATLKSIKIMPVEALSVTE